MPGLSPTLSVTDIHIYPSRKVARKLFDFVWHPFRSYISRRWRLCLKVDRMAVTFDLSTPRTICTGPGMLEVNRKRSRRDREVGLLTSRQSLHARRQQHSSRSGSLLAFLLRSLLTYAALRNLNTRYAYAQGVDVNIGSVIDEETLNQCKDALNAADVDGDKKVTSEEYISYIKGNDGTAAVDEMADNLVDIPLSLVMLFVRYACKCVETSGDPECCYGESAHLNIVDDDTPEQYFFFLEFCLDAQDAVTEIREARPTTDAPSVAPTREGQMSVRLQYTLTNDEGLDAIAIMTGKDGNTLKEDLETATRTIVIQTLNQSDPTKGSVIAEINAPGGGVVPGRGAGYGFSSSREPHQSIFGRLKRNRETRLGRYKENKDQNQRDLHNQDENMKQYSSHNDADSTAIADFEIDNKNPGSILEEAVELALANIYQRAENKQRQRRRLAFYTDELPPKIVLIIDDPACPRRGTLKCLLIFTRIYLLLEDGDDPDTVRSLVTQGMKNSFSDGSFLEAIPGGPRSIFNHYSGAN